MMLRCTSIAVLVIALAAAAAPAQPPAAADLFDRVPDDFGLCFVVNDLRGNLERWRKTSWHRLLSDNPLVRDLARSKDFRDVQAAEIELKRHLDLDFETLVDDIFGDAVVFAFQPAVGGDNPERGLLLVKARAPEPLADLVSKFNELQTNVGELTSLEPRKHNGRTYYRRVHQSATHFYAIEGAILAASNREAVIRDYLDRDGAGKSKRRPAWRSAGLDNAAAAVWIDPRMLDERFAENARRAAGSEAIIAGAIHGFWKKLGGVVISLHGVDTLEARLTLIAGPETTLADAWSRPLTGPERTELWSRFPDESLLSVVAALDFPRVTKAAIGVLSRADGDGFPMLLKHVAAATGLDIQRELAPHLGPDVGLCVVLGPGEKMPRGLFALGVRPEPKDAPVDRAIIRAANLLVGLAVVDYNLKTSPPIRVRTTAEDATEIRSLVHGRLFPRGIEPAWGLKEGYVVVGSCPDVFPMFHDRGAGSSSTGERLIARATLGQWSRLLRTHRPIAIDLLTRENAIAPERAGAIVDGLASACDAFGMLTLSHRVGEGQSTWSFRLTPAK